MARFDDIEFEPLDEFIPIGEEELVRAEDALNCRFPEDYRNFVTTFGEGEFNECPIRVNSPSSIAARTEDHRDSLTKFWIWEVLEDPWTHAQAMESIECFAGWWGDWIRFHPSDPSSMYVLPRESLSIHRVTSLSSLIALFKRELTGHFDRLTFTPYPRRHA